MADDRSPTPNPKRVAAGRKNSRLRRGLTAAGRERIREAVVRHRPWEKSTGPRTAEGKARSSANGRIRQRGERSVREQKRELAAADLLWRSMREARLATEQAETPIQSALAAESQW